MSKKLLLASVCLIASTALVARGAGKEDVQAAAKKLADAPSYAWTTKTEGGFFGGTSEGKAEKDGFVVVKITFQDNTAEAVKKGEKGAVKTDSGWKSFEEAAESGDQGQPNRERFIAMMMRNYKAPAAVVEQILAGSKDVKQSGDAFEAELTEQGAKDMLRFGGRRGGTNAPEISGAKGTAKFWMKEGSLSKVEYRLQGSINFNGQDRDIDRTTTIEIKDVGSAKVEVPEEARKKAS